MDFAKHVTCFRQYMIGSLAEIASGRRLFVDNYDRKTKETKMGIMQVTPEVAQWLGRYSTGLVYLILVSSCVICVLTLNFLFSSHLIRELGYKNYDIELEDNSNLLYWPFVNVYFGAAYAKWLFSCDEKYVIIGRLCFLNLIYIILYLSTADATIWQNAAEKELKNLSLELTREAKRKLLTNHLHLFSNVIFM